jgi:hypothetical protein
MTATVWAQHAGCVVTPSSGIRFGSGGVTVAVVEGADPVVLMAAVAALTPRAVERLDESEAEAFVVACERVTATVHARQSLAMDTLAGRVQDRLERARDAHPQPPGVPGPDAHSVVASMLSPSLHCATRTVVKRLEADRWLVCAAETTFAAQWQGELERHRADAVVDALRDVAPELCETFEALVLETSLDTTTGELLLVSPAVRHASRSELARRARSIGRELDPESEAVAAQRAHDDRRVVVTPDRHRPGLARWEMLLPCEVSQRVFAAIDTLAGHYARRRPGTTIGAHRADALADLVLANAEVKTTVELVVPLLAARAARSPQTVHAEDGEAAVDLDRALAQLGAVEAQLAPTAPPEPRGSDSDVHPRRHQGDVRWFIPGSVELPRHGVLLPQSVVDLLSSPQTMIRLATIDPDGSISQDPATYRPSASTVRRVRARDGVCRFPGCGTPANRTDLDHVVAFPAGQTEHTNLICLCRTHHLFKHHGGWAPAVHSDGRVTWRAPDGRERTTTPRSVQILDDLHLGDGVDPDLVADLRRGWSPGLPPGTTVADLIASETALPDDPPESAQLPEPPPDWTELDEALTERHRAPADQRSRRGPTQGPVSPLQRHLIELLTLAA